MARKEVGHFPIDYPTVEDGIHSVTHIGKSVLGDDELPVSHLVKHSWIGLGAGFSEVFPVDGMRSAEMEEKLQKKLTKAERNKLAKFAEMTASEDEDDPKRKIDFKKWVAIILPILLKLFLSLVLCIMFVGSVSAKPPQAPLPPQAPEMVAMIDEDTSDPFSNQTARPSAATRELTRSSSTHEHASVGKRDEQAPTLKQYPKRNNCDCGCSTTGVCDCSDCPDGFPAKVKATQSEDPYQWQYDSWSNTWWRTLPPSSTTSPSYYQPVIYQPTQPAFVSRSVTGYSRGGNALVCSGGR